MPLLKTVIRCAIGTAVVAGAVALIAGPQRTRVMVDKAHGAILNEIDSHIDDPSALRSQLRELEEQYPERISDLRGDLAQLSEQLRQVEREKAISERVVALTARDMETLGPLVSQAELARLEAAPGQVVAVRFEGTTLPLDEAAKRAAQIQRTRAVYATRSADAARDIGYLKQQQTRLSALLTQLEAERAEFRSQVWQLDRQVDAIARNDRLIELMDKRQKTIDECSRYEGVSLDKLHAKMAEVRSRQEAELEMLANDQQRLDYEDVARIQLDSRYTLPTDAERADVGAPIVLSDIQVLPAGPRER
jgi:chromosome segregation ATPase